jgi:[ribosomal protein S5]-alanine N-acetyltransferase
MLSPLETPRLLLRSLRDDDLETILEYRNDPQVYRYQGWKVPFTVEDGLEFFAGMQTVTPGTPGVWLQLAIQPRASGKGMIGDVAFHITGSNPRQAYIGYSLARSAWGQGFASEAIRGLLDYLFCDLDLHRVLADCAVENLASMRLLERLGFRREAHYVENYWMESEARWGSEYQYALLQREWVLR